MRSLLLSAASLLAGWAGLGAAISPNIKEIPLRTHSIQPPYLDADLHNRWFDFGGDTVVRADKYIRLAGELPSQSGWVWSKIPLTATNWEIEVEFRIHGKGNLHGDGMAMWLATERAQEGPVFGYKDKFEGIGIFFDTYKNNRPGVVFPYVMAMLGDGKTSYNKEDDGMNQELAGCSARGIRNPGEQNAKARLTHFQDKHLALSLSYKSGEEWTECFTTGPISIPSVTYLGFSAETGELSDNFDIISVQTKNLYDYSAGAPAQQRASTGKGGPDADLGQRPGHQGSGGKGRPQKDEDEVDWAAERRRRREDGAGFFKWAFRLFFFLFAVGMVYVGFTMWRASRRTSRFD